MTQARAKRCLCRETLACASTLLCGAVCLAQPEPKLLFLGIDGLRPDALVAADTPNIDGLIAGGFLAANARDEDLTFSGPNWSTILHGVHRDRHNVTTNDYGGSRLDEYPDLFEWLERHNPEWVTVRITTWDAIYKFQPTGADIDIFHEYSEGGDELAASDAAALLAGTHPEQVAGRWGDPDALFLYIADVDEAGHAHGFHPDSPDYLAAVEMMDRQVGLAISAMRARPSYGDEDWLVILTSDHGGSMDGGHAGDTAEKRTIPFIVSGPGVYRASPFAEYPFPQPRNVDGVTTALAHMGVPITPEMGLDGRVVGLGPGGRADAALGVNLLFNPGAEADRGMSDQRVHQNISGWLNPGPYGVTVVRYGSPDGYPAPADPGPDDRGENFFCGGAAATTVATQQVGLWPIIDTVDSGKAVFTLSGWLGGYRDQGDNATVSVRFLDGDFQTLGVGVIGPVGGADRGGATGLVYRETTGWVPGMSRWVEVELVCVRDAGEGNDGCADNLSLVIEVSE